MAVWPFSVKGQEQRVNRHIKGILDKSLSFEEICPQWSLALRLGSTYNHNLDIQDPKNCIVGEAHGFRNMSLQCSKCWEYSQLFTFCVYGNKLHRYIITDNQEFEGTKFDFVFHFNQKHSSRAYQRGAADLSIRILSAIRHTIKNLTCHTLALSLILHQSVPKRSDAI